MTITTTPDLTHYMRQVLGRLAPMLQWTADDDYSVPVSETLAALDIESVEDAENQRALLAIARRELWRAVVAHTVGYYTLRSPDGEQLNREQVHAHAVAMFEQATLEASVYDNPVKVRRYQVTTEPNPYSRDATPRQRHWWESL